MKLSLLVSAWCLVTLLLPPASCWSWLPWPSLTSEGGPSKTDDFDYFVFVRQWPGTYISDHGYHGETLPPPSTFTIHGLWPQYLGHGWPQFCDPTRPFEMGALDDLQPALQDNWPSYAGKNDGFWEHEWSKHGTCASSVIDKEHTYFQVALLLHDQLDLRPALHEFLAAGEPLQTRRLAESIYGSLGVRPVIHCSSGQLFEVWVCVGRDLVPFDCPEPLAAVPPPRTSWGLKLRRLLHSARLKEDTSCPTTIVVPNLAT